MMCGEMRVDKVEFRSEFGFLIECRNGDVCSILIVEFFADERQCVSEA